MAYRLPLFIAVAILAASPLTWLWQTWTDPSYNSNGWLAAVMVVVLVAISLKSGHPHNAPHTSNLKPSRWQHPALLILLVSGGLRFSGQILGIHFLAALTLAMDVLALGLWLRLHYRPIAVQPVWLALLFCFALPLERILQRLLGLPLQLASAEGACGLLSVLPDSLQCHGSRIVLAGQDVLVDLPCSGARNLLLLLALWVLLAALRAPRWHQVLLGLAITVLAAWAGNSLRIALLATGLVYPAVDVMAEPWHSAIGLLCLGLSAWPLWWWANHLPRLQIAAQTATPKPPASSTTTALRQRLTPTLAVWLLIPIAALIIWTPAQPVDVQRTMAPLHLPSYIGGHYAQPLALHEKEQRYFTQYGGSAARAQYGQHSLLLVRSSAPLRHLHAPDECLRGAGHQVQYLGRQFLPIPTAWYRSTDPQGQQWRIGVSFQSSNKQLLASVSEVAWHWLQQPDADWTMVQRISPWHANHQPWEANALAALDLTTATLAHVQ